ncbi:MAG: 4Fe-4S binding protein [Candidatus Aminicenantes bacterium]|nr:4Fe-4S binding protein [Candidatus Aminicenantes bacterium]NIM81027.1 4Fe-4S binding protein [Candidatus Aminicenantes bacterium]NIN20406.1 4Fe-4S binding protein [Candidatus Aminicenantes bacterium]NIN44179.1 4Fe-4S binding protein [Candidatus Aminicenantes bacterium]NIN86997.1 4Fe-4S binding protein [Candidatus Aminicenantes bacterium]
MKLNKFFILFFLLLLPYLSFSQTAERFPKPDFQTDYKRPDLITQSPRAPFLEYLDVFVLLAALSLASFFALKLRSRRKIFLLMVFCLIYFGFYREGCVCSIGAIQNVFFALFNSNYVIPFTVVAFFILPLIFTLYFGRTFCAAVCPLGAIQDVVVLKPAKVPGWLAGVLGIIPYIYLGLAVLFAAAGAGFIICQYDPFVGFFRFGASFNMVILGISMLMLGTVIARPYCRFFCPYGVLLDWMSRLAKWHVKITPTECNNCRLCEESCPFGAIKKPGDISLPREKRETEIKRLAILLVLLPVIVIGSGWVISRLHVPLSRQHFTVSLAEEIHLENSGKRKETTEQTRAFRASGKPTEELFSEAAAIQNKFKTGAWILGGFLGFIICLKVIGLSIRKKQVEYEVDTGTCLSCARCFKYCPYEQVRLGIISPDEIEEDKNYK